MSFSVKKIVQFPQGGLEYFPPNDTNNQLANDYKLLGGVFQDTRYIWQAKGPVLEIRNTKSGCKVGAWVFGGILKDSNTKIVCVKEIQRPNSRISLLAVGLECTISGGIICIFDVFSSKVIRAIQIKEKVYSIHVIDPGIEDLNLPGPLRNFDGILAVGTHGGDVILIDICRQICEESLHSPSKKDELNPAQVVLLTAKHIPKIEHYKELSVRDGNHLGIHLNAILDNRTEHFVLKGPKGDDRIHVNKEEVITSAIYYCSQLTSLLVGYNFGAFQLWDLTTLKLVYTSPVCDEHFPITNFALQEPTDDPRAFCYVWVSYSNMEMFQSGLPFAVMYSLCYESKEYHEGYGYLYQDFHYCNIRFQMELDHIEEHRGGTLLPKGGSCLSMQPVTKLSTTKDAFSHPTSGDTLSLCLISWTVWFSKTDTQTCALVFDLNQWYKEQMPSFTKWQNCNNYILRASLSDLIVMSGQKPAPILNSLMDGKSLRQFIGIQRLEEHFCPTSLSFHLWILRENDVIMMSSQGLQKSLLSQIESSGPLCLIRPTDVCRQALSLGLAPLFVDIPPSRALSLESQREIVLNIALEHQLIGWLCKCASEWANGSFSSAGCSLDFLITWAFQRAVALKTNCDSYCVPLFDYSQSKLDTNTNVLLNSCTRQINSLCVLYKHIVGKLGSYLNCLDVVREHWTGLEMVSVYFEVLQWLVNVGLFPECHPSAYPRPDNTERISAPYPVQELTGYYNERRAELQLLCKGTFESSDSLLFIDNLINRKCGGTKLQAQWQEDGGSGLYPPPSLQSLIRTYLIDGAGISHKHSLVIYLFLDLAMALDQSRYSSVVTHLIKFPAVFKVSPSIIKITQAFWQLDHGDFTTAMEQLLDPFVLGDDLQPWHHTIAMRSLLIHKQPNFALLYMQIRKPPITDEKDVMTAISLFIANNMLDEAFYFKKQHQNNNADKLLTHLFRECNKNDALHLVLYRCLNTEEEKTFFKYLKSVENPSSDDLQIFYYLLRSRFVEAFDTYSNIKRKCPDRQGLVGQSLASRTDQIVKIFKSLLPDVNKKLVDYIRQERTGLWKEVRRSTPMSVFVHNNKEQVQYKSTLIHAALSKAKQTFKNGLNESYKELITEETPFLRTPTVYTNGKRLTTPVIIPKIIDNNDSDEELAPRPSKRLKLSPRLSTTSPPSPLKNNSQSITLTPIVKRKSSLQQSQASNSVSNISLCTPQSILKVRHLVQQRDSITDNTILDDDVEYQARADQPLQGTSLRLQPRSSLSRMSTGRQHVKFDEATRFSSSLSDQSAKLGDITPCKDLTTNKSSVSSKDLSSLLSPDTEDISDEVFYSPDSSGNNMEVDDDKKEESEEDNNVEHVELSRHSMEKIQTTEEEEVIPIKEKVAAELTETLTEGLIKSPRARRSYKRSLGEMSPTRSSPRLSKIYSKQPEEEDQNLIHSAESTISDKASTNNDSMSTDSLSPKPRIIPKIRGRKSLSRQVLENNTFSKILKSPLKDDSVSRETSFTKSERVVVTEKSANDLQVTTLESNLEVRDTIVSDPEMPDTHKSHSASSYVTRRKVMQQTFDSDLSSDISMSFRFNEDLDSDLSDSLREYIDDLMTSGKQEKDHKRTPKKDIMLSRVQLTFDEDISPQKDDTKEQEEIPNTDADFEEKLEQDSEEEMEDNIKIDSNVERLEDSSNLQLKPVQVEESNHSLDDEDLPSSEVRSIYEINEEYDDISKVEESFNELEENIFGLGEESFHSKRSRSPFEGETSCYDIIADECSLDRKQSVTEPMEPMEPKKPMEPVKSQDVVVILSSEDDDEDNVKLNVAYLTNVNENSSTSSSSNSSEDGAVSGEEIEDHGKENLECNKKSPPAELPRTNLQELITEDEKEDTGQLVIDDEINCPLPEKSEDKGEESPLKKKDTVQEEKSSTTDLNPAALLPECTEKNEETTVGDSYSNSKKKENKSEVSRKTDPPVHTVVGENERLPVVEEQILKTDGSGTVTMSENEAVEITDLPETLKTQEKVDSSTNTTIKPVNIIPKDDIGCGNKDSLKLKVDRSTSTSFIEDTIINPNKEDIEVPHRKQVGHSRKKKASSIDRTTSSSDTTEGETFKKEIVTVQVHTSEASSSKKEGKAPERRITRKCGTTAPVIDTEIKNVDTDAEEVKKAVTEKHNVEMVDYTQQKEKLVPVLGRRTRRALSTSDTPARTISRRLSGGNIDCDPNTSKQIVDESNVAVKLTLRSKRSASVDEVRTFSRQRALKRNKTADEELRESSTERKAQSVSHMPVISEEASRNEKHNASRKSKSVVDSYTTSRRLTRRQAGIVKDITSTNNERKEDTHPTISIDLEEIDPIYLLDKGSFEGNPDPDENIVYEPSSPSTSTTTSIQKHRRRRSNSVVSEISLSPTQNLPQTPKRRGRSTRSQTKSPVASGISTRSKKYSETSSVKSEYSESTTPPKKSRKKKLDSDQVSVSAMSTRSRTASVSSMVSGESNSPRKVVRARRTVSAKSELPEITEEKATANADAEVIPAKKKQTRRKKTP